MSAPFIDKSLREFVAEVAAEFTTLAENLTLDEVACVYDATDACKEQLDEFRDHLRELLIDLADVNDRKVCNVAGLDPLELRRPKPSWKAWDKERLVPALVSRIIDEPNVVYDGGTGEPLPPHAMAANIARLLNECISFGTPKLPGLRKRGLDADEFATRSMGKPTARFLR